MTTIHMETELVYEQGRMMIYRASDLLNMADRMDSALRNLRSTWHGPSADSQTVEIQNTIRALRTRAVELEDLGRRILREMDEWMNADRTQSAYISALKNTFSLSLSDFEKTAAALILASTLRWTSRRPNSIVFTGPNWMRKVLGIKEMTRVIRPSTLGKGLAITGLVESLWEGGDAARESLLEYWQEDVNRAISAATLDGGFKFAITALGAVGIPLGLAALVAGLPVVTAGAIVIGGSVVLGLLYSKFVEGPVWELWKHSIARLDAIETQKHMLDRLTYVVRNVMDEAVRKVDEGFSGFIQSILSAPTLVSPTVSP